MALAGSWIRLLTAAVTPGDEALRKVGGRRDLTLRADSGAFWLARPARGPMRRNNEQERAMTTKSGRIGRDIAAELVAGFSAAHAAVQELKPEVGRCFICHRGISETPARHVGHGIHLCPDCDSDRCAQNHAEPTTGLVHCADSTCRSRRQGSLPNAARAAGRILSDPVDREKCRASRGGTARTVKQSGTVALSIWCC